jgi:GxxExxY protein
VLFVPFVANLPMTIFDVCSVVRETSFQIHRYFRSGHLEKIYANALAHRRKKQSIHLEQEHPIEVFDEDGTLLGHYVADFLIEQQLVVELKACSTIAPEHIAQVLGYLRGTRLNHGMLINFGAPQLQVRKLIL